MGSMKPFICSARDTLYPVVGGCLKMGHADQGRGGKEIRGGSEQVIHLRGRERANDDPCASGEGVKPALFELSLNELNTSSAWTSTLRTSRTQDQP